MIDKPDNLYDMRFNGDGTDYWTVYDVVTGEPAIVNGVVLDRCELEEADDLVDLLNAQYRASRGGTMH